MLAFQSMMEGQAKAREAFDEFWGSYSWQIYSMSERVRLFSSL